MITGFLFNVSSSGVWNEVYVCKRVEKINLETGKQTDSD